MASNWEYLSGSDLLSIGEMPGNPLEAQNSWLEYTTADSSQVFQVTNTNDSGSGSLRQAIILSNLSPGVDTIVFDSSLEGQTITLDSEPLIIRDSVQIIGFEDPSQLTIDGDDSFEVFSVGNDADVVIQGLTISGGKFGIDLKSGNLLLEEVVVTNGFQEGIRVISKDSRIVISNSIITQNGNRPSGQITDDGMDIEGENNEILIINTEFSGNKNDGLDVDGKGNHIKIIDSTFNNNGADGIDVDRYNNQLFISGSTFDGNVDNGIDLSVEFVDYPLAFEYIQSTIEDFEPGDFESIKDEVSDLAIAYYDGASLDATIIDSTISNNGENGIRVGSFVYLNVSNSLITGNSMQNGNRERGDLLNQGALFGANRFDGGGIKIGYDTWIPGYAPLNSGSIVVLENNTITENSAIDNGGGVFVAGNNEVIMEGNIIANNTADSNNDGIGDGGGIYISEGAKVSFSNTTVSDNIDLSGEFPNVLGEFIDLGGNLIGDSLLNPNSEIASIQANEIRSISIKTEWIDIELFIPYSSANAQTIQSHLTDSTLHTGMNLIIDLLNAASTQF